MRSWTDPTADMQAAIIRALEFAPSLDGIAVYDQVPDNAARDYIVLDELSATPDIADCGDDDKFYDGSDVRASIYIYTDEVGSVEAKRIGGKVVAILDAILEVDGWRIITHEVTNTAYANLRSEPDAARGTINMSYSVQRLL